MNARRAWCPTKAVAAAAACGLLIFLAACVKTPPPVVSTDRAKQDRFNWNFDTLVSVYNQAGHRSRAWNEPARRALVEFARVRSGVIESNEPWGEIIATNTQKAVNAGCRDPMIAYLHTRFALDWTNSARAFVDAYFKTAQSLEASPYPRIRKFYAWLWLAKQLRQTYGYATNFPPEIMRSLPEPYPLRDHLMAALADRRMPAEEAYEPGYEFLELWKGSKTEYAQQYAGIESALFANWSNAPTTWLLKGQASIEMAWQIRGGGYANTVTEQGWKGFEQYLKTAEDALNRAWELNPKDPRIAVGMMWVELGQGRGRDRMELWFRRAMELDPNDYDACNIKLLYLEPKWYGSPEQMLAFGWECAESTRWGGRVPLILVDAHDAIPTYYPQESDKTNYWKRPEVWPDIREAFDKFFQLNPDATGWYHNYAGYACLCEQWHALNALIPKLGPVNYAYFGGKAEFDKMLQRTKQHADDPETKVDAVSRDVRRLTVKIAAKIQAGRKTESDFADDLKACDALLAGPRKEAPDAMAQLLFAKAQLYWQAFDNNDQARALFLQLKRDFPATQSARSADRILAAMDREEEVAKIQRALAVGTPFPEFDEKDVSGQPLSLAGYRGKIVLIDFWATWCVPCVAELPNALKTYAELHPKGFEIIGISLDQDETKLKTFIQQKNLPWQQFFDGKGWDNKLAAKYGITSIPATYLLDRNGKIIAKDLRGVSLRETVAQALAGN